MLVQHFHAFLAVINSSSRTQPPIPSGRMCEYERQDGLMNAVIWKESQMGKNKRKNKTKQLFQK